MARSASQRRPLPSWFADSRLGIFIHWGPFAVPAFAPTMPRGESIPELLRDDPRNFGARMPYSEWYANAITLPESASARHHRDVWHDAPYRDFQATFEDGLDAWDPAGWADLFAASGATYVVLVTKHHDGYCLWPTEVDHPSRPGWFSPRDLVGELAAAVRARGLRFGVYYSTGLDWSVHHEPIRELVDSPACIPRDPDYVRYVTDQLDELVARYEPSVVWADIGTPRGFDVAGFRDRLAAAVPDAVINDRWDPPFPGAYNRVVRRILNGAVAALAGRGKDRPFMPGHHRLADFRTPEYSLPPADAGYAWEATRGLGAGFGHNAAEPDDLRIDPDDLVALERSIRAAGGRLLLNVGPTADGTIKPAEAERLRYLGAALASGDT